MRPALLVIDMQKGFFKADETTGKSMNSAKEVIDEAVRIFRNKNLPIVWIQHKGKNGDPVPGSESFELPDSFDVRKDDIRIIKDRGSAFFKTGLEKKLEAMRVDTVILTGFCAEYCVLATYKAAYDLDLNPVIIKRAIASFKPDNIPFVEDICDSMPIGVLAKFIENC